MDIGKIGKYNLICFTDEGAALMKRLGYLLGESDAKEKSLEIEKISDAKTWTKDVFLKGNVLIFIGAMGIAVRMIAPYIKDKKEDPAVIVLDEKGQFVIPVLSGHIGGGVLAARMIAELLGAIPVITTATDVRGVFAIDTFAAQNDLYIEDMTKAKEYTARLLEGEKPKYKISYKTPEGEELQLTCRCIVVGIGCKKGTDSKALKEFVLRCLEKSGISPHAVTAVTSIDIKKDEKALRDLASFFEVSFETYSAKTLMEQQGEFDSSDFVRCITGTDNVCERAVIAYGCKELLVKKIAENGMTFAAGMIENICFDPN